MGNYFLVFFSVALAAVGQLLMKSGMKMVGVFSLSLLPQKFFSIIFNPYVFSGLCCFMISSVIWLVVLSRMQLSLVYPLVSLGYIVVVFAAWLLFKEPVSFVRWLGVLIICFGVILITRS